MADDIRFTLRGLPEFKSRLRALGADMEKRIIRSAARAAGIIFQRAAKANAPLLQKPDRRKNNPRKLGALRAAIYVGRSRSRSKPGTEAVVVSVKGQQGKGGPGAFYWRWVEAGHLARGPGQRLKGGKHRRALERQRLDAAGARRVPGVFYLRNAFNQNQQQALQAFNGRIEQRIQKANRELNNL